MIRNLFRFLALALLPACVIALVMDGARSVAASGLVFMPLRDLMSATGMVDIAAMRREISYQYGADLWSVLDSGLLQAPVWFVFGVLALVLYIIGYRSPKPFEILSH